MPRGEGGSFIGNHGTYEGLGDDGGLAGDEEAVGSAVDYMFSMCGNAGQEAIIGNGCAAFEAWSIFALEGINGADGNYPGYIGHLVSEVGYSAWYGSQEIWDAGYEAMSEQSQFHDGKPDVGNAGKVF